MRMKVVTGTVSDGHIVVEGKPFAEGERVTVLGHDESEMFRVTDEEKRLLLDAIAEADREEFVDAEELLAELDESN